MGVVSSSDLGLGLGFVCFFRGEGGLWVWICDFGGS